MASPFALRPAYRCKGLLAHRNRLLELEGEWLFRGKNDVFIASESSSCSAGAASSQGPDRRSFTSTSQRADQRSSASSTADESGRPFSFAGNRARHHARINRSLAAIDGHRAETDFEQSSALEVAHAFCINHGSARSCASSNDSFAVDNNGLGYGS